MENTRDLPNQVNLNQGATGGRRELAGDRFSPPIRTGSLWPGANTHLAQMVERKSPKLQVVGSIPSVCAKN